VSGGVDSVVLLHALNEVNRRRKLGLTLHAAHVDHGLRARTVADAAWVRRLSESMRIPIVIRRVEVPKRMKRVGGSLEDMARRTRYAALEEMATDVGAACVAVGHHADDQAETVLHHVIRGTGLTGLAGMPAARSIRADSPVWLIRPLLGFTREQIEAYARDAGLSFREDETNRDKSLTRNRIRRVLLPLLKSKFNPRVVEALIRLAGHARDSADVIADLAADLLASATIDIRKDVARFEVSRLGQASGGVAREALRMALAQLGAPLQSLDEERVAAMYELLEGDGRRRTVELPGRFAAQRRGPILLLGPAESIGMTQARGRPKPPGSTRPRRAGRPGR